jgi:hypothetical protein
MGSCRSALEPSQLRDFRVKLAVDPEVVDLILGRPDLFPPVPPEWERLIRCALANVDRAVARMMAAAERGELWRVEIVP